MSMKVAERSTILIVDDDAVLVNAVKEVLEGARYRVLCAYDGERAVELAKAHRPDLIVMDVMMPTSGLTALESLRGLPETQKIPILFLTGGPADGVFAAIEHDARIAYLKKPLDSNNLLEMTSLFLRLYPLAA